MGYSRIFKKKIIILNELPTMINMRLTFLEQYSFT